MSAEIVYRPSAGSGKTKPLPERCQRLYEDYLGFTAFLFQAGAAVKEGFPLIVTPVVNQLQSGTETRVRACSGFLPLCSYHLASSSQAKQSVESARSISSQRATALSQFFSLFRMRDNCLRASRDTA